jgi:hypothetical protein
MFRLSALGLLVASVAVAAPVPKGTEAKLYYPTTVGAKRVMTLTAGQRTEEDSETVSQVEVKDGVYRVTVDLHTDGHRTTPGYVYEVSADGLGQRSSEQAKGSTSNPLLRLTVGVGESWVARQDGSEHYATLTRGKEEEIELPAGKFTAIRVDVVITRGKDTNRVTQWYAAGVGLVKEAAQRGELTITRELKEFNPGKGEKKDEPKPDKGK